MAQVHAQTLSPTRVQLNPRQAADLFDATRRTLENNFFRAYAVLDEDSLEQPALTGLTAAISSGPFQPRTVAGLSWEATALDENQATLCIRVPVSEPAHWRLLVQRALVRHWQPANQSCESSAALAPPAQSTQAFIKTLDRRDVPTPTRVPELPSFNGVDPTALTQPGLVLQAGAAFSVVEVHNPFVEIEPGPPAVGRVLSLDSLSVRSGFEAQHNCATMEPDSTCLIEVRYIGTHLGPHIGSLRGTFSNGARFRIGLMGLPAP